MECVCFWSDWSGDAIAGKWQHEEAVATASMCDTYLIVKNIDEAQQVASYILQEPGCLTTEELMAKFKHAMSPHFDPKKHLKRTGLANQVGEEIRSDQIGSDKNRFDQISSHAPSRPHCMPVAYR